MTDTPTPAPRNNTPEFSVSELSGAIKRALEDGFGFVRLKGEISGYRGPHSSGHCYFALKDDKAKIEAVIWKGVFGRLRFKPQEGMEVIAQGKITTFPGSSKYQIVIEALEPAGAGALMALLEERKKKFAAEGLFDATRKKKLPFLPRVIGIITSPTGAVIRDMLHGFNERFPAHVLLWPVRVQGEGSAGEVAAAIRGFNAIEPGGKIPRPDVLIVARGGGSLEDLWSFNEEIVVRAAAASAIPLISAVGHETDWTLIDLAADARAPTPTKAAEWAVPKYSELVETLESYGLRHRTAARRTLDGARTHLKAATRGLPRLQDLIALPRQRFDAADKRLARALSANTRAHAMRHARIASRLSPLVLSNRLARASSRLNEVWQAGRAGLTRQSAIKRGRFDRVASRLRPDLVANRIARLRDGLDGQSNLLRSLSYQSVLTRGFAIVRDGGGAMIRQAVAVQAGQALDIEFHDGRIAAEARGSAAAGGGPAATPVSSTTAKRRRGADQGNLF